MDARERTQKMFAAWADAQGRDAGWCQVKNEVAVDGEPEAKGAELLVYGVVGGFYEEDTHAAQVADQLSGLDVDRISVRVNSPGGSVYDGLAIMNVLRDHPAPVDVRVDGIAASAASVIAMAGDTVTMNLGSELMIHDAWTVEIGNAEDMRAQAEFLDRSSDKIAKVYAARAGGTAEQWRALMKAETWFDGDEAVEAGLADSAVDGDGGGAQASTDSSPRLLLPFKYAGRADAPAPEISPSAAPETVAPERAATAGLCSASVGATAEAKFALLKLDELRKEKR